MTGSTDLPNIIWLNQMNNVIISGVVTSGSMSTLTFNPLAASHAGTYTCRATLGNIEEDELTVIIIKGMC